jgi:hypothetical protein
MTKEYDFSKTRKSPYATLLTKQITLRLDEDSVGCLKCISVQIVIPYQCLIHFLKLHSKAP